MHLTQNAGDRERHQKRERGTETEEDVVIHRSEAGEKEKETPETNTVGRLLRHSFHTWNDSAQLPFMEWDTGVTVIGMARGVTCRLYHWLSSAADFAVQSYVLCIVYSGVLLTSFSFSCFSSSNFPTFQLHQLAPCSYIVLLSMLCNTPAWTVSQSISVLCAVAQRQRATTPAK